MSVSTVESPEQAPTIQARLIYLGILFVVCLFIFGLGSMLINSISTWPLGLVYGVDVFCEVESGSYKPGQRHWIFHYYYMLGEQKVYIEQWKQLLITGVFYIPFLSLILYAYSFRLQVKEIAQQLKENSRYSLGRAYLSTFNKYPIGKGFLINLAIVGMILFSIKGFGTGKAEQVSAKFEAQEVSRFLPENRKFYSKGSVLIRGAEINESTIWFLEEVRKDRFWDLKKETNVNPGVEKYVSIYQLSAEDRKIQKAYYFPSTLSSKLSIYETNQFVILISKDHSLFKVFDKYSGEVLANDLSEFGEIVAGFPKEIIRITVSKAHKEIGGLIGPEDFQLRIENAFGDVSYFDPVTDSILEEPKKFVNPKVNFNLHGIGKVRYMNRLQFQDGILESKFYRAKTEYRSKNQIGLYHRKSLANDAQAMFTVFDYDGTPLIDFDVLVGSEKDYLQLGQSRDYEVERVGESLLIKESGPITEVGYYQFKISNAELEWAFSFNPEYAKEFSDTYQRSESVGVKPQLTFVPEKNKPRSMRRRDKLIKAREEERALKRERANTEANANIKGAKGKDQRRAATPIQSNIGKALISPMLPILSNAQVIGFAGVFEFQHGSQRQYEFHTFNMNRNTVAKRAIASSLSRNNLFYFNDQLIFIDDKSNNVFGVDENLAVKVEPIERYFESLLDESVNQVAVYRDRFLNLNNGKKYIDLFTSETVSRPGRARNPEGNFYKRTGDKSTGYEIHYTGVSISKTSSSKTSSSKTSSSKTSSSKTSSSKTSSSKNSKAVSRFNNGMLYAEFLQNAIVGKKLDNKLVLEYLSKGDVQWTTNNFDLNWKNLSNLKVKTQVNRDQVVISLHNRKQQFNEVIVAELNGSKSFRFQL